MKLVLTMESCDTNAETEMVQIEKVES